MDNPKFLVITNGMHQTIPLTVSSVIERKETLSLLKCASPNNMDNETNAATSACFSEIALHLNPSLRIMNKYPLKNVSSIIATNSILKAKRNTNDVFEIVLNSNIDKTPIDFPNRYIKKTENV